MHGDDGPSADIGAPEAQPPGPWGWFEGRVVCPDCQTLEERRDASRRVAEAIEREVERRQREGVAPDRYEEPIIRHAMAQREQLDDGSEQPSPEPHGPVEHENALRHEVALTGAFLTGHPLAVRIDGYSSLQQRLSQRLTSPRWSVEDLRRQDGTYESGGGFAEALPLVIARRNGSDLIDGINDALRSADPAVPGVDHFRPLLGADLLELVVDIYDLGVAVLTATVEVVVPAGADPRETARAVKRLAWLRAADGVRSGLVISLQQIAFGIASEYGDAVRRAAPEGARASAWLSRASSDRPHEPAPDRLTDDRGRLLWLHPVHVCEQDDTDGVDAVAPTFHESLKVEGGVFAPGIGWSVVIVRDRQAAETPIRLTTLHWAYFALYMEIDRGLLGVLNQEKWTQRAKLKQLDADAADVFADYLRVMDGRARLDSALSALGGDELAIWDLIAKVQRFDAIVDAVERKLEVLDKVAQQRVDLATADRSRRMTNILGALGVLSVVTVTVAVASALVGSFQGRGIGSIWLRGVLIAASFVVACFVYWLAYIRTAAPPRRRADTRGLRVHRPGTPATPRREPAERVGGFS